MTPRRSLPRAVALGCLIGLGLTAFAEAGRVLVGHNFHTVEPGRVYRTAQPSPQRLERLIRTLGIRTVVNLRGRCLDADWYRDECRVAARLGVCQEDLCFSAGRLPSVPETRRLVEVLDRCEYPILMHCQRGADRTGFAAAVSALLHGDRPYAEARGLLGLRYGHLALGRPANLDRFFGLYEEWLRAGGQTHSLATFRAWLLNDYCPGECRAELSLAETPKPTLLEPFACRVRCRNVSVRPWRFKPGSNAGTHLTFVVVDADGGQVAWGKGGLFDAEVAPGESLDVTLALPGMPAAGRYLLVVDLCEEQHCSYFQVGSEPLEWEFEVRD